MPSIVEMLGNKVMDRSGELMSANMFTEPGKVVGLYFSSSWCPDTAFTPFLAKFFSHFRTTDRGQNFEIVYVSADKDKETFDQYFDEMPWHAVPYDDLQTRVSKTVSGPGARDILHIICTIRTACKIVGNAAMSSYRCTSIYCFSVTCSAGKIEMKVENAKI